MTGKFVVMPLHSSLRFNCSSLLFRQRHRLRHRCDACACGDAWLGLLRLDFASQESISRHWLVVLELLQQPEEPVVLEVVVIVMLAPVLVALHLAGGRERDGHWACLRRVRPGCDSGCVQLLV
jgi:hypothetical protein